MYHKYSFIVLKIFNHFYKYSNNKPWFNAVQIATILNYSKQRQAIYQLFRLIRIIKNQKHTLKKL